MHIYLVLVVSSLVVSVLSNIDKKNYLAHYLLACSICISIASLRFETGPDFFNYSNIFNNIKSGIESNYLNRLEPLYVLINILVIKINGNINTVFFFCSTIVFLNYFFAFKELKLNSIFLIFLYICLLYFPNILNLVRHGVAVSFVFLAFAKSICNKKLEALFFILVGAGFHLISLASIPFIFFLEKKISMKLQIMIFLFSLILRKFFIFDFLLSNSIIPAENYLIYIVLEYLSKSSNSILGIGTYLKVIIFLYYLCIMPDSIYNEKIKIFTSNLTLMFIISTFLFANIPTISERFSNLFTIGLILELYDIIASSIKKEKYWISFIFISISLSFFYQWMITPSKNNLPSFIPYKFIDILNI